MKAGNVKREGEKTCHKSSTCFRQNVLYIGVGEGSFCAWCDVRFDKRDFIFEVINPMADIKFSS